MIVETRSLNKAYDGLVALKRLDLAIEAGGIVGLLGPNGAGKTTLIEILEGLRPATEGWVRVLGRDPQAEGPALRQRLGVQLQATAFSPELTVLETLRLYAAFYAKARPTGEVLERVGLVDKGRARVRALSGGQRQRLALALAMLHDPELYLLDEPTSGLDPVARRGIHDILRDLKARGKTVLFSSHYLDEVETLAGRVVILRAGEVVADGTPLELLRQASGASTLWVAVEGEIDPSRLIPRGAAYLGREGEHLRFRADDPTDAIVALAESIRAGGARLVDLRLKRPTLEDLYVELVGAVPDVAGEAA